MTVYRKIEFEYLRRVKQYTGKTNLYGCVPKVEMKNFCLLDEKIYVGDK